MIEDLDVDLSYYNSLIETHKNSQIINIGFELLSGKKLNRGFPMNITIKEMIKAILSEMRIPYKYRNDYTFLDNGLTLNVNSDKYLGNIFKDLEKITIVELKKSIVAWAPGPGKIIEFTLVNDNNNNNIIIKAEVGTLEQIKDFYNKVKSEIEFFLTSKGNKLLENPRIYPGGIEVKENDERTFSSIGIRDNFICKVKL